MQKIDIHLHSVRHLIMMNGTLSSKRLQSALWLKSWSSCHMKDIVLGCSILFEWNWIAQVRLYGKKKDADKLCNCDWQKMVQGNSCSLCGLCSVTLKASPLLIVIYQLMIFLFMGVIYWQKFVKQLLGNVKNIEIQEEENLHPILCEKIWNSMRGKLNFHQIWITMENL